MISVLYVTVVRKHLLKIYCVLLTKSHFLSYRKQTAILIKTSTKFNLKQIITSNCELEVGCDPMTDMAVEGEVSGDRRGGTPEWEKERVFFLTVNINISFSSCSAVRKRKQWHAMQLGSQINEKRLTKHQLGQTNNASLQWTGKSSRVNILNINTEDGCKAGKQGWVIGGHQYLHQNEHLPSSWDLFGGFSAAEGDVETWESIWWGYGGERERSSKGLQDNGGSAGGEAGVCVAIDTGEHVCGAVVESLHGEVEKVFSKS